MLSCYTWVLEVDILLICSLMLLLFRLFWLLLMLATTFATTLKTDITRQNTFFKNNFVPIYQTWALALFFQIRSPLILIPRIDIAHFADFQVRSSLNRSKKKQWFALRKES